MRLLNLKWQDRDNAGDCCCSPCLYFPLFMGADIVHMNHWRGMDVKRYDAVIVGGGGLLNEENATTIQEISNLHSNVILWAIGSNSTSPQFDIPDLGPSVKGWLRHTHHGYMHGVCPSCLHPALLESHETLDIEGWVSHKDRLLSPPFGTHHTTNCLSPINLIRFIHSHRRIVTNSYHGAYFSWLLGKEVHITAPWSTKFTDCIPSWEAVGKFKEHRELAWQMYEKALTWIRP